MWWWLACRGKELRHMKKNREATELAKESFELLEQAYDEKHPEVASLLQCKEEQ